MDTTTSIEPQPGVDENPNGGYHIHVQLDERGTATSHLLHPHASMPPATPVLAEMLVFEDCVVLVLRNGDATVIHVSDPKAARSVIFFYHADGTLWRAVPLEQLNPGWVLATYRFWGDLRKFDARLAHMRSRPARPSWKADPTFWTTSGWRGPIMYIPQGLFWRIRDWQHSPLPEPQIAHPSDEQVERLSQAYPPDVQHILAVQEHSEGKMTYQIGGLNLVLTYLERIGLVEAVNRYCPRQGDISEGTVISVLVVNRVLSPCPLSRIAEWVADTGLHLLLGITDPQALNYDRLADALLAVYPHWPNIAAEITLRAVKVFGLVVKTIHYDVTSVFFHGQYEGSDWVTFGYSRDKHPDKPQVNIGLSATADGEVVLPGGSGIHPGSTHDGTTTLPAHARLHKLFQRSDLLVTGDSIMHDAGNMLTIARAHGRFLGATKMTPCIRGVVAACAEDEFETLPASTEKAGHEIKATFRHLYFEVKEKLTPAEHKWVAQQRRQRRIPGRTPEYREVRFWVRAAVILDAARREAEAQRRAERLAAYEEELKWTLEHLKQGRYYGDPDWVSGHLAELSHQFKEVRDFVKVTFTVQDGVMSLTFERRPDKMAQAAALDGKWVLVTNQPREIDISQGQPCESGQSLVEYLDWMWCVYKNHRHVERRMRNLKSDLPIRPIYLHRDDEIIALCFVSVVALMVYTLIERDCQANPVLVEAGLRTTDQVLTTLHGFCVSVCLSPSEYEIFWLDTPTQRQRLIWQQLDLPDPGTRIPAVRPASQEANLAENPASFFALKAANKDVLGACGLLNHSSGASNLSLLDVLHALISDW